MRNSVGFQRGPDCDLGEGVLKMKITRFGLLAVTAVCGLVTAASAEMINVQLVADNTQVNPGDLVDVDIFASTEDESRLIGFGFDFVTNEGLSFDSFSTGADFATVPSRDGDGVTGLSFAGGLTGSGIFLGSAQFTANDIGSYVIDIATTAGDLTEGFAQSGRGFFDLTVDTTTINVLAPAASNSGSFGAGGGDGGPAIPEPATIALLSLGLVAMRFRSGR